MIIDHLINNKIEDSHIQTITTLIKVKEIMPIKITQINHTITTGMITSKIEEIKVTLPLIKLTVIGKAGHLTIKDQINHITIIDRDNREAINLKLHNKS